MTLNDDIEALLPDNTTGAISAADVRAAFALVVATAAAEVDLIEARLSALELSETGGTTVSITGVWQINPQVTQPGGGQVTSDTGDFDSATVLTFAPVDKERGVDMRVPLLGCTFIYAQQKSDATNWIRYSASGGQVNTSGNVEVNVAVIGNSGDTPHAADWQDAIVVLGGIPTVTAALL